MVLKSDISDLKEIDPYSHFTVPYRWKRFRWYGDRIFNCRLKVWPQSGPRKKRILRNFIDFGKGPEDEQSLAPVSALASATICFSQLSSKSRNSWAVLKALMSAKNHENCSGASYLQYKYRVKKLGQFMDHGKSYATLKFRKNEVFVS